MQHQQQAVTDLHPANAEELANIAGETGAEVLRGALRYPSESGGWHLGDVDLSEHLGKYLCVYSSGNEIRIRTGNKPEGPWSPDLIIFKDWSVGDAVAHSEFSLDGGRKAYFSYTRDWGAVDQEIRLLEVTFR